MEEIVKEGLEVINKRKEIYFFLKSENRENGQVWWMRIDWELSKEAK